MPHGGGHISHGGGRGHHFGGGGHHHHHTFGGHHHHRHYGGVVYTTGGGGYYYRSRYRGFVWGGVGMILIITIIISVSCSVTFSKKEDEEHRYLPGDTRIKNFDNFFCSGVKSRVDSYNYYDNSFKAYVIDKTPPLSIRNNLTLTSSYFTLFEDDYYYWHSYLYKNSNITIRACQKSGSGYWVYIIKGTSKWNNWKDYASSSKAIYSSYITTDCDESPTPITIHVPSDDHYYIAYYNDDINFVDGSISVLLKRYEYDVPTTQNVSSCSFGLYDCSLNVPMFSDQSKVLITIPYYDDTTDDPTPIHVDIDCIPRVTAYLIVVLPSVGFLIAINVCIILCCWYRKSLKKRQYEPLLNERAKPSSTNTTAQYQAAMVPPPVNPEYPGTLGPPPPYQQ